MLLPELLSLVVCFRVKGYSCSYYSCPCVLLVLAFVLLYSFSVHDVVESKKKMTKRRKSGK